PKPEDTPPEAPTTKTDSPTTPKPEDTTKADPPTTPKTDETTPQAATTMADSPTTPKPEDTTPEAPTTKAELPTTSKAEATTPEASTTKVASPTTPKPEETTPQAPTTKADSPTTPKPEDTTKADPPSTPKPEDTTPPEPTTKADSPTTPKPEATTPEAPTTKADPPTTPKPEDTTPEAPTTKTDSPTTPKPEDTTKADPPTTPRPEDTTPEAPTTKAELPTTPKAEAVTTVSEARAEKEITTPAPKVTTSTIADKNEKTSAENVPAPVTTELRTDMETTTVNKVVTAPKKDTTTALQHMLTSRKDTTAVTTAITAQPGGSPEGQDFQEIPNTSPPAKQAVTAAAELGTTTADKNPATTAGEKEATTIKETSVTPATEREEATEKAPSIHKAEESAVTKETSTREKKDTIEEMFLVSKGTSKPTLHFQEVTDTRDEPQPSDPENLPVKEPEINKPLTETADLQIVPGETQEKKDEKDLCNGKPANGMVALPNGTLAVFRGHYYWLLNGRNPPTTNPRRISDGWGIPSPIDAVFSRCNCDGKTFFIKGPLYWRFTNGVMDKGYPKPLANGFAGLSGKIAATLPVARYNNRPESVYFIKKDGNMQQYVYRQEPAKKCQRRAQVTIRYPAYVPRLIIRRRFPRAVRMPTVIQTVRINPYPSGVLRKEIKMTAYWRGLPKVIHSTLSLPNHNKPDGYDYYAFSYNRYYSLDIGKRIARPVTALTGKTVSKDWYNCPSK
ncbi:proteoglycan 4, partial [Antrostomus carolinensis]|uniref:proteoglycan 4 n=1 Tax=Antrostomus carolinensis TaxID=279965 RepID=UPI0010A98F44